MIIGMVVPYVTAPVLQRACKIPTEAEELWMAAVKIAPAATPSTGLLNMVSTFTNSGTSASGLTAELMISMPYMRTANPMRISPISYFFSLFMNIMKTIATAARIGENAIGFSIWMIKLSP